MNQQQRHHGQVAPDRDENCHVDPLQKSLDQSDLEGAVAAYLAVSGMGCPNCATRVSNGLLGLEGVLAVHVDLKQGLAVTAYDPEFVSPEDLIQAVANAGRDGRHHYGAQFIQQVPISWLPR